MSPIQQMLLGAGGAVAKKTFIDDVFSTFLYKGNDSSITVNNSLDLSTEGGLVWVKNRTTSYGNFLFDTERGTTTALSSNLTNANFSESKGVTSFNSNGFTIGGSGADLAFNSSSHDYVSWSFRKSPFFTCLTYTGNGNTPQAIAHNLSSIPGMVIVKRTDSSNDWMVLHRSLGASSRLELNSNNASGSGVWGSTEPTSTHFYVGGGAATGANGATYVAYLFAGGESTAATARSVAFDGNGDYLSIASTSDFNFGTGDFTVEFWALTNSYSGSPYFCDFRTDGSDTGTTNRIVWYISSSDGKPRFWVNGSTRITATNATTKGVFSHYALVRSSGTTTMYINGISQGTYSDSTNYGDAPLVIGQRQGSYASQSYDGRISNFRIVKGTAVYTSSFRPPTEPLTNITNTKLLCCNNSSTTGSTVTPGTITANGNPTASTDSPFDDPAGFVFGDSGTENVIKNGSFKVDSGNADVYVGFEPQWVLVKNITTSGAWFIFDVMRGIVSDGLDAYLRPDSSNAEGSTTNFIDVTPTGFKISNLGGTQTFMFTAIRRSDGYVGKLPELGTDVFAMDNGNPNSTPGFTSGFPVDFYLYRDPTATGSWQGDWGTYARLIAKKKLWTNKTDSEGTDNSATFAFNDGVQDYEGFGTDFQAWMWKRHAGCDVVTYTGSGVYSGEQQDIFHSLNAVPEMMWVKRRDASADWMVYHKGLNGGTNPEQYRLKLNTDDAESSYDCWNQTAPTAIKFRVGDQTETNQENATYIAMLFSSVDGISSVGSFTGPDPEATITIDCGFQPRFVMIKCSSHARNWVVFDTVRGIAAGADKRLALNTNAAQITTEDMIDLTSSGFSLPHGSYLDTNWPGREFIYYAHA